MKRIRAKKMRCHRGYNHNGLGTKLTTKAYRKRQTHIRMAKESRRANRGN